VIILGVDPGVYGALAFVVQDPGETPIVYRMPMDGSGRHGYQLDVISDCIFANMPDLIVVEKVTRPASLVRCMALFEGLASGLEIECMTVRPQVWKKHFGLTKDKQGSIDLALELFPGLDSEITKISDDGVAEAVLIAQYGWFIKLQEKLDNFFEEGGSK